MRLSSIAAILGLELVTVAIGAHAPFVRSNETAIITPVPSPSISTIVTSLPSSSLSPTTTTSSSPGTTMTFEPIKAGVSYVDTTSIVSVLYVPTGTMTTLMVAPGKPTAEATVPRAGFRTYSGVTTPALASATPIPSTTVAADSGARVSHVAHRGLLWGCLVMAWLGYGRSIM